MVLDFHNLTLEMYICFPVGQTPDLNETFGLEMVPQRARENREKKKNRKKSEEWRKIKILGKNMGVCSSFSSVLVAGLPSGLNVMIPRCSASVASITALALCLLQHTQ